MDICEYGCGKEAKYTIGSKRCCESSCNRCEGHKRKRRETNLKRPKVKCEYCDKEFSYLGMPNHLKKCKLYIDKECLTCGKKMRVRPSASRTKYCSYDCSNKNSEKNKKASELLKEKYKNGEQLPYGGGMKRYEYLKIDFTQIKVQGLFEFKTCYILDNMTRNKDIKEWEYTSDCFSYKDENNDDRTYFPDFKIFENDGTYYYLETKGFEKERDKYKWKGLRDVYKQKLIVWFEDDIKKCMDNKDS